VKTGTSITTKGCMMTTTMVARIAMKMAVRTAGGTASEKIITPVGTKPPKVTREDAGLGAGLLVQMVALGNLATLSCSNMSRMVFSLSRQVIFQNLSDELCQAVIPRRFM
jgi:hypothetical protein